jgi:hypothetical protein
LVLIAMIVYQAVANAASAASLMALSAPAGVSQRRPLTP